MKHTLPLVLLFLLSSCTTPAPQEPTYFQGEITYAYYYESDQLDADSLTQHRAQSSNFRYDDQNYQSTFYGKDTMTYYYLSEINKCLSQKTGAPTGECEDYGVLTDSILNFRVYDTEEKVLGQACRIIEFQGKYFWNLFYVSKEQLVAPATYQRHLAYNWAFYGDKTNGGLILKIEHRFAKFTMYGEASTITPFQPGEAALQMAETAIKEACED